jgi:hypothetical protein
VSPPLLLALWLQAAPAGSPAVTVVVEGPAVEETKASLSAATLPVSLRLEAAPTAETSPAATSPWPARLAAARTAYVTTDFAKCLQQLEGDAAPAELLAAGERGLVARLLAWRVACHTGARQPELARAAAWALAAFQVPLPDDVASMTPEAETLLARAQSEVGARPLVKVRLESNPAGASVELDGRPVACTTPCEMELLEGAHVVRMSADGYTPAWRVLARADGPVTLEPAAPELAAAQWRRRLEKGDALDSTLSLRLLSTSLRAPRLVVLASDPATPALLRGALAIDGQLVVRAERRGDAEGLMKDLLVRGRVVEEAPPLYARWPFWVAVGVAVAAGVTTAVVVVNQDPRTSVVAGFQ